MAGVVVQPMIEGVEVTAGLTQDPLFGPLVAFGFGGIQVEILGDDCFRATPLIDRDAAEMADLNPIFELAPGRGCLIADARTGVQTAK